MPVGARKFVKTEKPFAWRTERAIFVGGHRARGFGDDSQRDAAMRELNSSNSVQPRYYSVVLRARGSAAMSGAWRGPDRRIVR